jgi:uncharacterized RDD family membrane protein YckC
METNDGSPPLSAPPTQLTICGFWRRIVALIIDCLVLGLFGEVLGLFFFDFLAHLGGWGRLIGFGLALGYFALLNSALGRGKTVGKRIMGIEVIDSAGRHISVGRSFLRYLVLGVPFFLHGAILPLGVFQSPVGYLIELIALGGGGSIAYLYVFNRRTRQSLHDLAVGTFVVRGSEPGAFSAGSIWRPHLVIAGVWCLAAVGISEAPRWLLKGSAFSDLIAVQEKLLSSGKVLRASATIGDSWSYRNGAAVKTSFFRSDAIWRERPGDYKAAAEEVASVILANYPGIAKEDFLDVSISYGYDIGIARMWIRHDFRKSPGQWANSQAGAN